MVWIELERLVEFLDRPIIIGRVAEDIREPHVGADIYVICLFGQGSCVPFFCFFVMPSVKICIAEVDDDFSIVGL